MGSSLLKFTYRSQSLPCVRLIFELEVRHYRLITRLSEYCSRGKSSGIQADSSYSLFKAHNILALNLGIAATFHDGYQRQGNGQLCKGNNPRKRHRAFLSMAGTYVVPSGQHSNCVY
jgi:hypothetical protein